MSHRRESGAVPPWVIPETVTRKVSDSPCDAKREVDVQKTNHKELQSPLQRNASGDAVTIEQEGEKGQYLHLIGGEIVNNDCIQKANVLIKDGKIVSIGKKLGVPKSTPTIDASGFLLMPGGVDNSTYILGDGSTINPKDYINTTKEAVLGGTTTIVDTIVCPKGQLPIEFFVRQKQRLEGGKLWCNIIYRLGLLELSDAIIEQMEALVKKYNVTSFVFFTSATEKLKTGIDVNSRELKKAMHKCRQLGLVPLVKAMTLPFEFAANDKTPPQSFDLATTKNISLLAEETGCPLVIASPTNVETVGELIKFRNGIPPVHVYTSCTPNVLLTSSIDDRQHPSKFLNYITCGDVTTISSDHVGSTPSDKFNAIGRRLVTVWEASVPSGWLDATGFVQLTSTGAARLLGIYPRKGRLSPGSDADIVLWPSAATCQVGMAKPTMVIIRGQVVARDGKLVDVDMESGPFVTVDGNPLETLNPEPLGEILITETFPTAVYSVVQATDRLRKHRKRQIEDDIWNMKQMANDLVPQNTPTHVDLAPESPAMKTETPNTPKSPTCQEQLSIRMVHGHRDLHASGFSLSGAQVDDNQPHQSGIRTRHPPGGESRNPLW